MKQILFMGAALLFTACLPPPTGECSDYESQALGKVAMSCPASPWHPWHREPPFAYTFTFTRQCFCFPDAIGPFFVKVQNGVVTEALRGTPEGDTVAAAGSLQSYSLDSLWNGVNATLAHSYHHAFVRHDSTWGFPDSFYVDPIRNAADDESGMTITDFRVIILRLMPD